MKITICAIFAFLLIGFTDMTAFADNEILEQGYVPTSGFVPNEEVAIKIAEAVLFQIYGSKQIQGQKPYQITNATEDWIIQGTILPDRLGGTFLIRISKADGRIRLVTHSK